MINRMKIILIAVAVILGASGISFAMSCDMDQAYAQEAEKGSKTVNIGNKVCPVSGDMIEESKKATYEYNGKIYNFCCPMCIDEFKKDPTKYSAKAQQSAGGEHSMSMQEGHQHEH